MSRLTNRVKRLEGEMGNSDEFFVAFYLQEGEDEDANLEQRIEQLSINWDSERNHNN